MDLPSSFKAPSFPFIKDKSLAKLAFTVPSASTTRDDDDILEDHVTLQRFGPDYCKLAMIGRAALKWELTILVETEAGESDVFAILLTIKLLSSTELLAAIWKEYYKTTPASLRPHAVSITDSIRADLFAAHLGAAMYDVEHPKPLKDKIVRRTPESSRIREFVEELFGQLVEWASDKQLLHAMRADKEHSHETADNGIGTSLQRISSDNAHPRILTSTATRAPTTSNTDASYSGTSSSALRQLASTSSRSLAPESVLRSRSFPTTSTIKLYDSVLNEWCQRRRVVPIFSAYREGGADHLPWFRASVIINGRQVGVGEGTNKKEAKRDACRVACEGLGIIV